MNQPKAIAIIFLFVLIGAACRQTAVNEQNRDISASSPATNSAKIPDRK
ncbi:MAG: hypothetical protein ABI891_00390 [Acidobacteriota bacterium]